LAVRKWVLTVPKRLRYFLHDHADLHGAVLRESGTNRGPE
jgi:hypothetical protein